MRYKESKVIPIDHVDVFIGTIPYALNTRVIAFVHQPGKDGCTPDTERDEVKYGKNCSIEDVYKASQDQVLKGAPHLIDQGHEQDIPDTPDISIGGEEKAFRYDLDQEFNYKYETESGICNMEPCAPHRTVLHIVVMPVEESMCGQLPSVACQKSALHCLAEWSSDKDDEGN